MYTFQNIKDIIFIKMIKKYLKDPFSLKWFIYDRQGFILLLDTSRYYNYNGPMGPQSLFIFAIYQRAVTILAIYAL